MFKSLLPVLAGCSSLSVMIVPGEGETLTVTVLPKPKKFEGGEDETTAALSTPLSLTGTAAELDEKFAEILGKYAQARTDLEEQLEATTAILDAAKQASSSKATTALKKKAGGNAAKPASGSPPVGGDDDEHDDDEEGEKGGSGNPAGSAGTATTAGAPAGDDAAPNLFS